MGPHRHRQSLCGSRARVDVVAPRTPKLHIADHADGVVPPNRRALRPLNPIQNALGREYQSDLPDGAPMATFNQIATTQQLDVVRIDDDGGGRLKQLGLVALDHQEVVALLYNNLFGNAFLAPHAVHRNRQAFDWQRLPRLRNGGIAYPLRQPSARNKPPDMLHRLDRTHPRRNRQLPRAGECASQLQVDPPFPWSAARITSRPRSRSSRDCRPNRANDFNVAHRAPGYRGGETQPPALSRHDFREPSFAIPGWPAPHPPENNASRGRTVLPRQTRRPP